MGIALRYWIQMPGKQLQQPQLNIYEIAYLAGGKSRAVELAITQLVHLGYLRPNVRNRTFSIEKLLPIEATQLDRQIMLQVRTTPDFNKLKVAGNYLTSMLPLQNRLEQEQLLMSGWRLLIGSSFMNFMTTSITCFVVLVPISPIFTIESNIIWNIIIHLWLGLGILTFCCFVPSGRTRWGHQMLADIHKNHDVYDVLQGFAINGYRVLSGGALDDLKQIYKEEADADSAAGCGC
jgi:uncharacterized protein (TIGR04222 family)